MQDLNPPPVSGVDRVRDWFRDLLRDREDDGQVFADGSKMDLVRMFPATFTVATSVVFLVPTWIMIHVATLEAISYFSARWAYVMLLIPLTIVGVHIVHMRSGGPNKYAIIVALIVPTMILLICSKCLYMGAIDKNAKLFSVDCDTSAEKRALQHSWEVAYTLYTTCLQETSKGSSYSVEQLQAKFRIQDCEEYQEALGGNSKVHVKREEWEYLAYLEQHHNCAGWCYHGESLWSNNLHRDSCSVVVAQVYSDYVIPHTSEVFVIMLVTLAAAAAMLVLLGPMLRKQGINW